MTDLAASPEQKAIEPARVPAALAGPSHPSELYKKLRTERWVAGLPAATALATGAGDCLMHERMMAALHLTPSVALVAPGIGAVVGGLSAAAVLLVLRATGTLGEKELEAKTVLWGGLSSGAALTLIGNQPVLLLGYAALTAIATGKWHKARWIRRRALKQALLAKPEETAEAAVAIEPAQPESQPLATIDTPDWHPMLAGYMRRWKIGVATGSFDGSELCDGKIHDEGRVSFTLQSGPKGIRLGALQAAREDIESALRLKLPNRDGRGGQTVVFDQPAEEVADRGQVRVQIIDLASKSATSSRVTDQLVTAEKNPYSVRIASYIDNGEPAFWDFADYDGAWSGVVLAGTGMGKSSLEDSLAYKARLLGAQLGFHDPQMGASSPVLTKHAEFAAFGADGAVQMLHFLNEEADIRESWMGMHGLGKITPWTKAPCRAGGEHPDPDCPCGGVVPPMQMTFMDEVDQTFNTLLPGTSTKLGEPYGKLVKRIRKLDMGIVAFTQLPELKTFGNSDLLRSNLPVRNLLAMHVASNVGGNLIPGLPYSPKLLPKISGRGLMCGQASRQMEVVLDWGPRREDSNRVKGPYIEDLFEVTVKPRPYGPDQEAAKKWLPSREGDAAAASRREARERFSRLLNGRVAPVFVVDAPPVPTPTAPPAASLGSTRFSWPGPVTARCAAPTVAELEAMRAATAGSTARQSGVAAQILDAVAGMPGDAWVTFGDLARRLGRVAPDADNAELRARARDLSAELAGYAIPMRKREVGMAATVAEVRAALTGRRPNVYAA